MVVILSILQEFVVPNNFSQIKKAILVLGFVFSSCFVSVLFAQEKVEASTYIKAKEFYVNRNDDKALELFFDVCKLYDKKEKDYYFYQSVLYSARIYFDKKQYESAIPLLENVVASGTAFEADEYYESLQKLLFSYNKVMSFQKVVNVYNKLDFKKINPKYQKRIMYFCAAAYENLGDLQKSKELLEASIDEDDVEFKKDVVSSLEKVELLIKLSELNDEVSNFPAYVYNLKEKSEVEDEAASVLNSLAQLKNDIASLKVADVNNVYNFLLIKCNLYKNDFNSVQALFKKLENPTDTERFYYSISLFAQGKYAESEEALNKIKQKIFNPEYELLKAKVYQKLDKTEEALSTYKNLFQKKVLPKDNYYDYAETLFKNGDFDSCIAVCKNIENPVALYLQGLCFINTKNWKNSENCLVQYVNAKMNEVDFNVNSYFYLGYSQYLQNKNNDSYVSFQNYLNSTLNKAYEYEAEEFSAKLSLRNSDYEKAIVHVQRMLGKSKNSKNNEESILFASEVYSDAGNYDKALSILQSYLNEKSTLGLNSILKSAEIYEKMDNVKKADELYRKAAKDFSGEPLAESALYHTGEIYFVKNDFKTAIERFLSYLYAYPKGLYCDLALYFAGESNLQLKELDKSIMQNENLVQNYEKSVYLYAAYKNLMNAYYQKENYEESLRCAEILLAKFRVESEKDNVQKMETILKKVQNGEDIQIAEKYAEYELLGLNKTEEGRNKGTEVAILLNQNAQTKKRAYELASSIYKKQIPDSENASMAECALIIGEYKSENYENEEASKIFLQAAELFRKTDNPAKAAASLYNAVVSFVAVNQDADAKATADLLKELYPQSVQAKRVNALLK